MFKAMVLASLAALSGCSGSDTNAFNAEDDLDCAMLFLHGEKNEKNFKATEEERRTIFIMRTWYFKNMTPERAGEAQRVVERIKQHPQDYAPAISACGKRAMAAPGFNNLAAVAAQEFERQAK